MVESPGGVASSMAVYRKIPRQPWPELAETGSLSIEKAAIHPRGCTVAGGLWKHAAVLGAQVF
jgi:hypothetical protein